jgi:hypothetical protein
MVGIIRALVLAATLSNFICDVRCLTKPHVTVVGAGFGGWGAVKALCENGCRVTLLDVLPDPTGATPYVTPTGKPDSEIRASARSYGLDEIPFTEVLYNKLLHSMVDILSCGTQANRLKPARKGFGWTTRILTTY